MHSDQGANFESELIAELLRLSGVSKSHTTAYHPMGNGATERFNRTLGSMLRSLPLKEKHKWPQQIQTLTFAYNATVHETTGYAPFQLMFGRTPRLPVDVMFRQVLYDPVIVDYNTYAKTLISHLNEAARIAQQHSIKEQNKQAKSYDRKVKGTHLNIGDRVLIANKGERGKRKLADRWNAKVYTVKGRNLQTHTYKLEDSDGHIKVVHRNLVLDISFLPVVTNEEGVSVAESEDGLNQGVTRGGLAGSDQMVQDVPELEEQTQRSPSNPSYLDRDNDLDSLVSECDSVPSLLSDTHLDQSDAQLTQTDTDSDTPTQLQAHSRNTGHDTSLQAQPYADTEHVVRTRAGRVSKRVDRLIESMIQKASGFRAGSFGRKSQSLITLF